MKMFKIKLLLIVIAATFSLTTYAQNAAMDAYMKNPKWGTNPDDRKGNVLKYNYLRDAMNSKDYPTATKHLQDLLAGAPKSSQNIYIYAAHIYEGKVERATSLDEKKIALDSLMYIYDMRAEHFGDSPKMGSAKIKENKAKAYYQYNPSDITTAQELFNDAIVAGGAGVNLKLVNFYYKTLVDGYALDIIEDEKILDEYNKLIGVFDQSTSPDAATDKATFEALFISSGAANCDNIEALFKDKIAAAPDDIELLEKTFRLLSRGECESDFYIGIAEKYYVVKPSAEIAIILAAAFQMKEDFTKALRYLNEAVANETDPTAKANLYVNIGGAELELKNASGAAKNANLAIAISPENAYAYIVLGSAYLEASKSCTEFHQKSVYWLAYDAFSQARRYLQETDAQMESIKSRIVSCHANFPTTEECFFRGLNEGETYDVDCGWVRKKTTIKYRK